MSESQPWLPPEDMPRWVWKATAIFWLGFIITIVTRSVWSSLSALFILLLVSFFLSLAIEPGVNRLAARGWRRGTATIMIMIGVLLAFVALVAAVGIPHGQQSQTM